MGKILSENLAIINMGIKYFYEALEMQKVPAVDVDWRPPVEKDKEIESLLDLLL